ncbi:PAS domain-containing protein, partial [Thermotoga sp.]|uniref:PAS domain-containing protein n=1 Tax=Thermotoga sp. TaxID=28240 RepID=UPI0025CCF2E7
PTVLGRPVQFCHPPRSVHIVNKILKAFKEGRKKPAEFWINMGEKKIHIRYIPVLDKNGNYIGTLEVVQDITSIKNWREKKDFWIGRTSNLSES